MKGKLLILLMSVLILSGCAVTLTDFNQLKARIDELEKKSTDNKTPADPQSKEEMKALNEQNQHIFTQMQVINNRLTTLENKTQENAPSQVAEVAPTIDTTTVVKQEEKTQTSEANSIEDLYNEGRRLYSNKDYSGSIKLFSMILDNNANHELAGPAQYWVAECFYALSDFSAAKIEFQKIIKSYPSSSKYIDAQVKIALCMVNLNQKDKAKLELQRIKRDYPKYERKSVIDDILKKL